MTSKIKFILTALSTFAIVMVFGQIILSAQFKAEQDASTQHSAIPLANHLANACNAFNNSSPSPAMRQAAQFVSCCDALKIESNLLKPNLDMALNENNPPETQRLSELIHKYDQTRLSMDCPTP